MSPPSSSPAPGSPFGQGQAVPKSAFPEGGGRRRAVRGLDAGLLETVRESVMAEAGPVTPARQVRRLPCRHCGDGRRMTQASRREADHSLKTASPDVYGPTADHIVAADVIGPCRRRPLGFPCRLGVGVAGGLLYVTERNPSV